MKSFLILVCVVFIPCSSFAQSSVDRLVEELEFMSKGALNNWRYSTSVQGDPTSIEFNDAQWGLLKLGESIYPDSCWIRKEVVLPERMLGEAIHGPIRFLVSVDDYGYLWINGTAMGHFPWDGEFELTKEAQPGQKFVIAIKAINTGGPLRLLRAQIVSESSGDLRESIENLSLSLRVGQKLLSFDTYQTNARVRVDPGTDRSAADRTEKERLNVLLQSLAAKVDVDALRSGSVEGFKASVDSVRSRLTPVKTYAKRFTLYFDSNAHIDAAWLWREKETIEVCRNTFSSVLDMMEAYPEFTYTQSSAAYYSWMERYPELFGRIRQRIQDGRWEVVGGMWVEPDCNLPGGESWARHLLYGKRYFKDRFGIDVRIGWNPDSFGYNWNMPQFYQNAGIGAFITQKIGWNDTNVFPHRVFWWESPDGSRILSYFPFDYVNSIDNPYQLVDWLRQFEANTGFTKMMILFGVGDHGGGPSREMLERIERLKSLDIFPAVEFGTAGTYLGWLGGQDLSRLPVWNDELYLEYHQGTFTTQAGMKEFNRKSEVLLTNAEKFSALSTLHDGVYNRSDLELAWTTLLFNQFHDILPGSSIREVYVDANATHQEVQEIARHELSGSLKVLARHINTSAARRGIPVVVFNPLSWERTDIVEVNLPESNPSAYAVYDMHGKNVRSQSVKGDRYTHALLFVAESIPPIGYKLYELREERATGTSGAAAKDSTLAVSTTGLENEFFKVTVDPKSGWVQSIVDKRNGKEVLTGFGNELQLLEDRPSAWDAWNVGLTGVRYPSRFRGSSVAERGTVRVVLRLSADFLKPGVTKDFPTEDFPSTFFTQDIILYSGIDRIDFKTDVDWWEEKTMLKVAFPVSIEDSVATYEIPFGTIGRSTRMRSSWEKGKVEVPALRWADLSSDEYGISLLNDAKYGYDIKGNVMRLSLLRSPKWPDPTADRGKHTIHYALYPHRGRWRNAQTVQRGYEYNNPLIAVVTDRHRGVLPPEHTFVKLEPSNLVLTSIKKAEDSDAWVFQWYDARGEASSATLQLPRLPARVVKSNFLEEDLSEVPFKGAMVVVPTGRNAVMTLKVYF